MDYINLLTTGDLEGLKRLREENKKLDKIYNYLYGKRIPLNVIESVIAEKMYGTNHRDIAKRFNIGVATVSRLTQGIEVTRDNLVRLETVKGRKFSTVTDKGVFTLYDILTIIEDEISTLQVYSHNIGIESCTLYFPTKADIKRVIEIFA